MESQRLIAFTETARHRSMRVAAELLGFSTAAVSAQIAALERELGVRLFDRVGRGVHLSDAGVRYLDYATRMLALEHEARNAVEREWRTGDPTIVVRLGLFGSLGAALVGAMTAMIEERAPGVTLRAVEVDPDDAASAVLRGLVDIACGLEYPEQPKPATDGIRRRTIVTERFGVVANDGAVRPAGEIRLADLADQRWIMPSSLNNFGRVAIVMCHRAGFQPQVAHEVTDSGACLALAAAGLGITLATPMMMTLRPEHLQFWPVADGSARDVVLFTRTTVQSAAQRTVIEILHEIAAELYPDALA